MTEGVSPQDCEPEAVSLVHSIFGIPQLGKMIQTLKVMVPLPRFAIEEDIDCPHIDVAFRAPTAPREYNTPTDSFAADSDEIVAVHFADGATENNLSEVITNLSGIDESDFCQYTTMVFSIQSNSFKLRGPTRVDDEMLLQSILDTADHLLDGIRIDYCRLDLPQMCIGSAGYVSGKNKNTAFVFDANADDGRIIAREPDSPIAMPGIGLDFESIGPSFVDSLIVNTFPPDSLGVRLKRLLRVYASVLCSATVESRILTLVFYLDGILTPENSNSGQFKKYIAVSVTNNTSAFQSEYDKFKAFYRDVRNPLVHHGKSYGDLGRDCGSDLRYLQFLFAGLMDTLAPHANTDFDVHWAQKMDTASGLA